ncbi:3-hydroxybutyryl-CoA dehydrogenase [Paraburkholderia terrae]|uniref:3-hydroxybutyryl-CoA dehydrogenase n=1 Tax=Paraburkholderia terrae TaxID=311230 RepID=A0A2I8EIQ6_9BURK|nr:3-hydroxybutyryl-CoA dehydrogenase [Paraburkholderia terrae]AUT59476.1 3-hydroxybutyryl-CoA dehydrogenase [Paraburkholderia terrae]
MQTIGIVGAGQMGSGIALVCATAGLNVILNDLDERTVERGIEGISSTLARMVSKGKTTSDEATGALARIKGCAVLTELVECDLAIEAATENVHVKEAVLRKLDTIIQPRAIIATNTSSVSVTRLGATLADPSRFIGMHFFNPVPAMALVEVIRGLRTSDATFDATIALAKRIGKSTICVKNSPGFVVNRILIPMINEAVFVLQEGLAGAAEIDEGMKLGANHPIGPLALADLIGLDTTLAIMNVLYRDFNEPKYRPAPLLKEMVDAGYLGRKSGQGFHIY